MSAPHEQRRPGRGSGAEIISLTGSTTSPRYRNRRPGRVRLSPDEEMLGKLRAAQHVIAAIVNGRMEPTVTNVEMARRAIDSAAMWAFMASLGAEVSV